MSGQELYELWCGQHDWLTSTALEWDELSAEDWSAWNGLADALAAQ